MSQKTRTPAAELRQLPSIDSLLRTDTAKSLKPVIGTDGLTALARKVTSELRQEILAQLKTQHAEAGAGINSELSLLSEAEKRLAAAHNRDARVGLRRVINATGVILHTNLGRAPLSAAAQKAMVEVARYCSLEYDLNSGTRGRRGARAEDLLASLCGAEAALVVNNCAAAALLVLTVLARDGEAIVSRGELVEIGGDFRVPDVMAQSGTRMVEVGTTNRTKLADFKKAINPNTRLILRVHTSNYRIVGFTQAPGLEELASLAREAGLFLYEDAGSGALIDFTQYGISGEPIIRESIAAGADVISFSGDKLLGGPQAGLLVGRADVIERMRKHPLYRSLRADKFRIAALEATLESYARDAAQDDIPTHTLISSSFEETKKRAEEFVNDLRAKNLAEAFRLEIVEGESAIGGGAAPTSRLRTALISIGHANLSANDIEQALRDRTPPVISRIEADRVLIDLRTVFPEEAPELTEALLAIS